MKSSLRDVLDHQTTYGFLLSAEFDIKQDFLETLKEMELAGRKIKKAFLPIKDTLEDKKISWKEIDLLLTFIGSTIPSLWNSKWSTADHWIERFSSSLTQLFKQVQYVYEVRANLGPSYEGLESSLYYLDGVKYQQILDLSQEVIDLSPKNTDIVSKNHYSNLLKEIFQYIGLIRRIASPYSLITPMGKDIDQKHPLNIGEEMEEVIILLKKKFDQLPSIKLLSLSEEAGKGLQRFLDDKKLSKDNFKAVDFWGAYKRGVKPVDRLFTMLRRNFT